MKTLWVIEPCSQAMTILGGQQLSIYRNSNKQTSNMWATHNSVTLAGLWCSNWSGVADYIIFLTALYGIIFWWWSLYTQNSIKKFLLKLEFFKELSILPPQTFKLLKNSSRPLSSFSSISFSFWVCFEQLKTWCMQGLHKTSLYFRCKESIFKYFKFKTLNCFNSPIGDH